MTDMERIDEINENLKFLRGITEMFYKVSMNDTLGELPVGVSLNGVFMDMGDRLARINHLSDELWESHKKLLGHTN